MNIFKVIGSAILGVLVIVSILSIATGNRLILGERVQIEPTELGMVLDEEGFTGNVLEASRFRLEQCFAVCQKLIRVDASDRNYPETIKVFMAQDDVFIDVPLNLTLRLNREFVRGVFGTVPHVNGRISVQSIYDLYAKEIIITTIRGVVSQYSVDDFLANQEAYTIEALNDIQASLDGTPFSMINGGIREIGLPQEITDALLDTANRKIQVRQQEEQLQVDLARLQRELEEANKEREVEITRARTEAEIQEIIASGFTPEYESYRMLDILMEMAKSDNKVFVPLDMAGGLAGEMLVGNEGQTQTRTQTQTQE